MSTTISPDDVWKKSTRDFNFNLNKNGEKQQIVWVLRIFLNQYIFCQSTYWLINSIVKDRKQFEGGPGIPAE